MSYLELLASSAEGSVGMMSQTLADFSDADLLVRPCAGANHAAWQLSHLCNAEAHFAPKIGTALVVPAKIVGKGSKQDAANDDPAYWSASKSELLETLTSLRKQSADAIRKLTPDDLAKPSDFGMFPTVAHLVVLYTGHIQMHLGQFQVIRRKLAKPIMF